MLETLFCYTCNQHFEVEQFDEFENHKCHKNKKVYTCVLCLKKYTCKAVFKIHVNHCGQEGATCEYCNRQFENTYSLVRHKVACLSDKQKYKCDYINCNKAYISKGRLHNHKQCHEGEKFHCTFCNRFFKTKCGLSNHKTRNHSKLCPRCSLVRFPLDSQLEFHLKYNCVSSEDELQHLQSYFSFASETSST